MDFCTESTGVASRTIRATENVQVNTTLCTARPYAHILMHKEIDKRCSECFKCSGNLLRCIACSTSRYCSKGCQRKAWRYHKIECKGYKKICPMIPKDSMLLLLRLLIKSQENRDEQEVICGVSRSFHDLVSHSEDIQKDSKRCEEFSQTLAGLQLFAGQTIELPNTSTIFEVFGKMLINTFSICDGEMQPIGAGLYLGPSALDHSCCHNSIAMFDGVELSVRAIQPISCGEVVTISYLDVLISTEDRRAELSHKYYFICQCSSCNNTERGRTMNAPCCTEMDELNSVAEAKSTLERVKQLKADGDADAVVQSCLTCLDLQRHTHTLTCYNIYHLRLLDFLFDAYINLTRWTEAVDCGRHLTDMYRYYLPDYHPTLGIHLMKVGKIQLYIQHHPGALKTLQQAEVILKVTHGVSHPVYKELLTLVQQCLQESTLS